MIYFNKSVSVDNANQAFDYWYKMLTSDMEKEDNLLKVMSDVSYCSDKYQYTMGKSFLECGMKDKIAQYEAMKDKVKEACERELWDGEWYIRGITKSGRKIGTSSGHIIMDQLNHVLDNQKVDPNQKTGPRLI